VHEEEQNIQSYRTFIISMLKTIGNEVDLQLINKRKVLELLLTANGFEVSDVVKVFHAYAREISRNGQTSIRVMSQLIVYLCARKEEMADVDYFSPFLEIGIDKLFAKESIQAFSLLSEMVAS
jgi:hypothetical protein